MDPDRIEGLLLGTAIGDALGLPLEGLPATPRSKSEGYQLFGERGYVSDDTEQTALVAEALIRGRWRSPAPPDVAATRRAFARSLRWWLARLPFGIGGSTLRAILGLWLGRCRGVASAGNGAMMRAAIVGVIEDPGLRREMSVALATLTHTDPRATTAAQLSAEIASLAAARPSADRAWLVTAALQRIDGAAREIVNAVEAAVSLHDATPTRAAFVLGTSGYVVHSVGWCVYVFVRLGDQPHHALETTIAGGGDTDTHAAIVGAWLGALHGSGIWQRELVANLDDGPFGRTHLRGLAHALAHGGPPPHWSAWRAFARNLRLWPVILAHGFRRLLPW